MEYVVQPVDVQALQLPSTGLPQPVPDLPAVELLSPASGPVLVVRPFGQDPGKNPEQRHTVRLLLFWRVAR
jgi:hypothetical protein